MHAVVKWILVCSFAAVATRMGTRFVQERARAWAADAPDSTASGMPAENDLPAQRRHEASGIDFVLIRAGRYVRGAASTDPTAERDEMPAHEVRITRPFYLAVTEVTQDQWRRIMHDDPSHNGRGPNWPVESVNLEQIREFCRRTALRLPSEAEWEYACGAEHAVDDPLAPLTDVAWVRTNSNDSTQPVGLKPANRFGVKDMLGNVAEWTSSIYDAAEYARCSDGVDDPLGPPAGNRYAIRGGAYFNERPRATARDSRSAQEADAHIGFRVVLDP